MPTDYLDLHLPPRVLPGPGPSMVHPRVLRTMATPLVGHLNPQFIALTEKGRRAFSAYRKQYLAFAEHLQE